MAKQVPARLTLAERRRFGLTVGAAFLVIAALSRWRGHDIVPFLFGGLGSALILAGALLPQVLGPVYQRWMALARLLSKVTTPVFMGIIYFIVITPMGFLRRLFGGNPLRPNAPGGSYWMAHESSSDHSMTRQF